MKRIIPMLLVLAAPAALALERSATGTGQVILVPYYSVQNGESTLVSGACLRTAPPMR
jgi:hypothetical protein